MSKLINGTALLTLAAAGLIFVSAPSHAGPAHNASNYVSTKNSIDQIGRQDFDHFDETAKKKARDHYDPKVESKDNPINPDARGRFGGHSVNE